MKHRDPIMVILLSLITLGIYTLVWSVRTKNEMNTKGAQIPTAWLSIIPFVNWYWWWKFSEGVEIVTSKAMGTGTAFLLLFFLGTIGMAIIQDKLNKVAT
ncbi:MAG: DUF4234 domain-containing protein [Dehalococcoidales bacterium]|nr:DUF4234 domain-containing protein [Dehalococcoidales bacterium]